MLTPAVHEYMSVWGFGIKAFICIGRSRFITILYRNIESDQPTVVEFRGKCRVSDSV